MKLLTLDFETKDPYIDRGLEGGWVYKINVPTSDFELLGCAYKTYEGKVGYTQDYGFIQQLVNTHTHLVMHNASYDLGCCKAAGIDTKDMPVFDTEVMSRLYNSSLQTHNLDYIASLYLGKRKDNKELTDAIMGLDVLPYSATDLKKKTKDPGYRRDASDNPRIEKYRAECAKWSKKNLDILQKLMYNVVEKYAIKDVELTERLFKFFEQQGLDLKLAEKYSSTAHICVALRIKGVRVDLKKARSIKATLEPVVLKLEQDVYRIAGTEFNLNSSQQIAKVFDDLGIEYNIKEDTGNPSIDKNWMAEQFHPICKAINEYRKVNKVYKDFICAIIEMQEFTGHSNDDYGRVYPSLNLLRAATGRFSCSAPNIQQIPKVNDDETRGLGYLCRSIYVPEEGEKWFSIDYSSQEIRLQVHYANRLKCDGADLFVLEYTQNPELDVYTKTAELAGVSRKEAKVINLGLSYGMGISKLSKSLKTSVNGAKEILERYHEGCPYLKQLNDKCMASLKDKKQIKTIGGRQLKLDPPTQHPEEADPRRRLRTYEYKALNKLIQGSAADQTIEAMIQAYKTGIPILFPVHDELCMSGTKEQALALKNIMESVYTLDVPVVAALNIEGGSSWAEAK